MVYLRQNKQEFKLFGMGLGMNAAAFLLWAYITGFHPAQLAAICGIGVLLFIAAFGAFFASSVTKLNAKQRSKAYLLAGAALIVLTALRFVFYKSHPGFSADGFFSFNTDQIVLYAYVITMSFSIMPAVYAVSEQIKNGRLRNIMRFGFTLVVISTVILITSPDNYLQYINGWGMMGGLILLAITHTVYKLDRK